MVKPMMAMFCLLASTCSARLLWDRDDRGFQDSPYDDFMMDDISEKTKCEATCEATQGTSADYKNKCIGTCRKCAAKQMGDPGNCFNCMYECEKPTYRESAKCFGRCMGKTYFPGELEKCADACKATEGTSDAYKKKCTGVCDKCTSYEMGDPGNCLKCMHSCGKPTYGESARCFGRCMGKTYFPGELGKCEVACEATQGTSADYKKKCTGVCDQCTSYQMGDPKTCLGCMHSCGGKDWKESAKCFGTCMGDRYLSVERMKCHDGCRATKGIAAYKNGCIGVCDACTSYEMGDAKVCLGCMKQCERPTREESAKCFRSCMPSKKRE